MTADVSSSDIENQFVGLVSPTMPRFGHGTHPCQGLYWTPKGKKPRVALIATHYNVDFMEHYLAPYMAQRGYGFLGWNTRFRGAEDQFLLEHALIDIGVGMKWLREKAGVEKVVILGNSGGGSLMAAYQGEAQSLALAGTMKGPVKEALEGLPKADLYISLNAHLGRPEVLTAWMDGSVTDETDPTKTDESLNPFNPDNGPPFSQAFITRYRAAQRARNQRITDWAKAELARLNKAGIPDRIFPLFRTWADLRFIDPAIDPSTRPCPGCYRGDPAVANRAPSGIGRANTLKTWLSMWSLETSQCRGEVHLGNIKMPSLVIQSTGDMGVFPSDAKQILESLGAKDKTLQTPPGAHYFEDAPQYRGQVADMIAAWIGKRV
ncbi:MAG: alpha/beta hydrolase [Alphaproteobacteria bacterium]|mgnify:CR=1 FL=1|jgi:pimeloyl-ACP methyl ester carboxylesterase|nr:alpha/beta hydrolase [Alphaproteobacteria bacterium]